jgi:hypothetical protein
MPQISLIPPALITSLLFFDLETVAKVQNYSMLSPEEQKLWDHQTTILIKSGQVLPLTSPSDCWNMAAIIPEFSKICSASFGIYIEKPNKEPIFYQRNYTGENELDILQSISKLFETLTTPFELAGYNIDTFDIPFLIKRFIITMGSIPYQLDFFRKKPWEMGTMDLAKIWQGSGRSMVKFDIMANALGIPTPKEEMYGGDVYKTFYEEQNLPKIAKYCDKDVYASFQCARKMAGLPIEVTSKKI